MTTAATAQSATSMRVTLQPQAPRSQGGIAPYASRSPGNMKAHHIVNIGGEDFIVRIHNAAGEALHADERSFEQASIASRDHLSNNGMLPQDCSTVSSMHVEFTGEAEVQSAAGTQLLVRPEDIRARTSRAFQGAIHQIRDNSALDGFSGLNTVHIEPGSHQHAPSYTRPQRAQSPHGRSSQRTPAAAASHASFGAGSSGHNPILEDRTMTQPIGLHRTAGFGAAEGKQTCFVNSLLQTSLFRERGMRDYILFRANQDDHPKQRAFAALKVVMEDYDARARGERGNIRTPADQERFLGFFISNLSNENFSIDQSAVFDEVFELVMEDYHAYCVEQEIEPIYHFQIPEDGGSVSTPFYKIDLDGLRREMSIEHLLEEKGFNIRNLPPVLALQLSRGEMQDGAEDDRPRGVVRNNVAIGFSSTLSISIGSGRENNQTYELDAFISSGDPNIPGSGSHYISFAKVNDQWYQFNDNDVRHIHESVALERAKQASFVFLKKEEDTAFGRGGMEEYVRARIVQAEELQSREIEALIEQEDQNPFIMHIMTFFKNNQGMLEDLANNEALYRRIFPNSMVDDHSLAQFKASFSQLYTDIQGLNDDSSEAQKTEVYTRFKNALPDGSELNSRAMLHRLRYTADRYNRVLEEDVRSHEAPPSSPLLAGEPPASQMVRGPRRGLPAGPHRPVVSSSAIEQRFLLNALRREEGLKGLAALASVGNDELLQELFPDKNIEALRTDFQHFYNALMNGALLQRLAPLFIGSFKQLIDFNREEHDLARILGNALRRGNDQARIPLAGMAFLYKHSEMIADLEKDGNEELLQGIGFENHLDEIRNTFKELYLVLNSPANQIQQIVAFKKFAQAQLRLTNHEGESLREFTNYLARIPSSYAEYKATKDAEWLASQNRAVRGAVRAGRAANSFLQGFVNWAVGDDEE